MRPGCATASGGRARSQSGRPRSRRGGAGERPGETEFGRGLPGHPSRSTGGDRPRDHPPGAAPPHAVVRGARRSPRGRCKARALLPRARLPPERQPEPSWSRTRKPQQERRRAVSSKTSFAARRDDGFCPVARAIANGCVPARRRSGLRRGPSSRTFRPQQRRGLGQHGDEQVDDDDVRERHAGPRQQDRDERRALGLPPQNADGVHRVTAWKLATPTPASAENASSRTIPTSIPPRTVDTDSVSASATSICRACREWGTDATRRLFASFWPPMWRSRKARAKRHAGSRSARPFPAPAGRQPSDPLAGHAAR